MIWTLNAAESTTVSPSTPKISAEGTTPSLLPIRMALLDPSVLAIRSCDDHGWPSYMQNLTASTGIVSTRADAAMFPF
jgi:hypothetical protein